MPQDIIAEYVYLGDRHTDPSWKNRSCLAVRNSRGKCIRGRNGNMLVVVDGRKVVVQARLLRKRGEKQR